MHPFFHDTDAAGSNARRGDANMAKLDAETDVLARKFKVILKSFNLTLL